MPEYDMAVDVNGKVIRMEIVPAPNTREAIYKMLHEISPRARVGRIEWRKVSDAEVEE